MTGWQDEILVGYVDGELDPAMAARLEADMVRDPELRRRVEIFRSTSHFMRAAFEPASSEPVPRKLLEAVHRARFGGGAAGGGRWRRAGLALAASIALLVAGAVGGFYAAGPDEASNHFVWVEEMVNYYKVYADDDRRLVELGADRRAEIEEWFSERLNQAVKVPDLSEQGLTFRGGRLVALDGRPASMLVYDGPGGPVAFCITAVPTIDALSPSTARLHGFQAVYWARSGYVFLLTGAADEARLRALVSQVDLALAKG
jgi:anti-sigma factor RsiW